MQGAERTGDRGEVQLPQEEPLQNEYPLEESPGLGRPKGGGGNGEALVGERGKSWGGLFERQSR